MTRCRSQLAAATARGDLAAAQEAQHRLDWIFEKQRRLDLEHEMVTDKPSWQNGREVPYGSLQDDARRLMTWAEIEWNEELISEEAAAASSSVATGATPAAATASMLGAAGTAKFPDPPQAEQAQSGAIAKRSNESNDTGFKAQAKAMPVHPPQVETAQSGGTASMASSSKDTPEDGAMLKSTARPDSTGSRYLPLMCRTDSHPPRRTLTKEVDDADQAERDRRAHVEAERDRQAHVTSLAHGTASSRATTAKSSKEEMKNAGTSAKLQQPRRSLELQQHISPSRINAQSTSPS